jgi:hypothetical protein
MSAAAFFLSLINSTAFTVVEAVVVSADVVVVPELLAHISLEFSSCNLTQTNLKISVHNYILSALKIRLCVICEMRDESVARRLVSTFACLCRNELEHIQACFPQ